MPVVLRDGFAVLDRTWTPGDVVQLSLPMPVLRVRCDPRVEEGVGRVALQRGPLVYCVEGRDAGALPDAIAIGRDDRIDPAWEPDLLGGVVVLRGPGFTAVPYCTWANRGPGPMSVWLRERGRPTDAG